MKAVRVAEVGGPEVLRYEDVEQPTPGPGEALVKIAAVGVNFIDIQQRSGRYKPPALPFTPGSEAAGTVAEVAQNVKEVKVGDRVAYAMVQGAYAEYAVVPARRLVRIPESLSFESAAAVMLQGMTAHYLTHSTCGLEQGDVVLVHGEPEAQEVLRAQLQRRGFPTVHVPELGESIEV